jgi:hypothetical protein
MLPIISFIAALSLIFYFVYEQKNHTARLTSIKYRIHVNGIRGKSSDRRLYLDC